MEDERLRRDKLRDMSTRYRLFRWFMRGLGRLLFGFTVHGAERAPAHGPLIVAANHRRYADPVLVSMAMPRKVQWMAKKELFVFPFERFFYFIGSFPVDRQRGGRAALKAAISLLKEGWALGIFPEGTRRKSYDPEEPPKSGVGMLAARAGAPILPVYVGELPNPFQRLKGQRLHIYIGNPIIIYNTINGGRVYRREVASEVLRKIYGLKDEKRSL